MSDAADMLIQMIHIGLTQQGKQSIEPVLPTPMQLPRPQVPFLGLAPTDLEIDQIGLPVEADNNVFPLMKIDLSNASLVHTHKRVA